MSDQPDSLAELRRNHGARLMAALDQAAAANEGVRAILDAIAVHTYLGNYHEKMSAGFAAYGLLFVIGQAEALALNLTTNGNPFADQEGSAIA
jgi:hypothetical protein